MLDRLITYFSCLEGTAVVGSATMLMAVEEIVVTDVVDAMGAVFEVVTATEVLVWWLELTFAVFAV